MAKHHPTARRVHRTAVDEDAFVSSVLETSAWAKHHGRVLTIGGVTLAVLLSAGLYYANYRNRIQDSAAEQLSQVRATVTSGNVQLAKQDLDRYVKRFGNTSAGAEAKLMLAQVQLQSNEAKAAVSTLNGVAGDADTPLGYSAALLLGSAYEQDKQPAEAEKVYLRVADQAKFAFQKREALDRAARLRVEQNNATGAAELYERILATFEEEDDPAKNEFAMRLAEIRAQGLAAQKS